MMTGTAFASQLTWYGRQPRQMAVYTRLNCNGNACQSRLSEPVKSAIGEHLNERVVSLSGYLHPHRRLLDPNPLYSNRARVDSTTSS